LGATLKQQLSHSGVILLCSHVQRRDIADIANKPALPVRLGRENDSIVLRHRAVIKFEQAKEANEASLRSQRTGLDPTRRGGAMRATWVPVLSLTLSLALTEGQVIAGPLHDAAQAGDVGKVQELIAAGSDINEGDQSHETPLIKAALARQTAVAAALIEAGADVRARNNRGFTALHAAAYSGSVEIATMLLDHGVPVDDKAERYAARS
jgi:ankyrin repeat protein